jgi:hypothetical protein
MVLLSCLLSLLAGTALGKINLGENNGEFTKEQYVSGEVHMSLKERKMVCLKS